MAEIEIYTTTVCPYCVRAKALLTRKGQTYQEINLNQNPDRRDEMLQRAGGKMTVPQIFINGTHVGGCDELYALDKQGGLDPLLGLAG